MLKELFCVFLQFPLVKHVEARFLDILTCKFCRLGIPGGIDTSSTASTSTLEFEDNEDLEEGNDNSLDDSDSYSQDSQESQSIISPNHSV